MLEEKDTKISIQDTFLASLVDVLITGAISLAGLFLVDGILRITAGYYVKEKAAMFLIVYIITSLLYTSIMESGKGADTIGKRAAKLKLTKTQ